MNQLTEKVEERLTGEYKEKYKIIKNILKELEPDTIVTVEGILNYVRQIKEITTGREDKSYEGISGKVAKELDDNICKSIFYIIKEHEDKAKINSLRKFFVWLYMMDYGNSKEVFTTNYDMLLEKSMEANYIPYFDGFVGAYEPFFSPESIDKFVESDDMTSRWIRLWKIHGSLNWKCANDEYKKTDKIIRTAKLDEPDNELLIYPSKEKYSLSRKQPFIAYFDRLKKYLLQGELVFVFSGYSFFDQHINDIIFNCLRENPRLYVLVLCYSDEQLEKMKQYVESYLNICVMSPTEVIVNGKCSKWVFDESNEDSPIDSDMYWDKTNKQLTLGDFTKLIEFLVYNSGKRSAIEEALNEK